MPDPTTTSPPTTATDRFIEGLGLLVQKDGLPRIAGRMLGLFIIHGGPLGFAELSERLQVSRASVSTNTRLLSDLGFLERVAKPGDRRDYYRLADDPYGRLLDGYLARLRERLELIETFTGALSGDQGETLSRLGRMRTFYSEALTATEALMTRLDGGNQP